MASGKSSPGMKPIWPGRNSHLSDGTGSDSDVKFTVDSIPPKESAVKKSPLGGREQSHPAVSPGKRSNKESTFEDWNPMEEDYRDKSFNNYNRGPGAGLSGVESGRPGNKKNAKFSLFVGNIPTEMTEEGLLNLFSHVCDIRRVRVCQPKDENSDTTFGFVDVPSVKDGEEAIRRLDGHTIRSRRLKVAFKREKDRPQDDLPHTKQESPDEWDTHSAETTPSNKTTPTQKTIPKAGIMPSGSAVSNRAPSGGSEVDWQSSGGSRKPPQPRRLEDRYGTSTKPVSPGGESQVKSLTSSVLGSKINPAQSSAEPVSGAGSKMNQSPLQTLLQKMRNANVSSPEPSKEKSQVSVSVQPVGQKVTSPEVKGSAEMTGKTGTSAEREIDFNEAEESSAGKNLRQAFAEKLKKAGIVVPRGGRQADNAEAVHPTNGKEDEGMKSNPVQNEESPKPLLSLKPQMKSPTQKPGDALTLDQLEAKRLKAQPKGQAESPSGSKTAMTSEQNKGDGILGPAPQQLLPQPRLQTAVPPMASGQTSNPHSPGLVSGGSYCSKCAAHEYHQETEPRRAFHTHPQSHAHQLPHYQHHHHHHQQHPHHHNPQPWNGPYKAFPCCEGYPPEEPCQVCLHHGQPYPHRQAMSPPFGLDPSYGPVPPYSAFHYHGPGPARPYHQDFSMGRGYYNGRDIPRRHAAGFRGVGYQANRSTFFPSPRGKAEPPVSNSKNSAKTQKTSPDKSTENLASSTNIETSKKNPLNSGTASGNKEPEGGRLITSQDGESVAEIQGPTNPKQQALPKPVGGFTDPDDKPTGKSVASVGDGGQRSSHKGTDHLAVNRKPCINCGKAGLQRCGRCKSTYCSKECQKEHWPTHKLQCRKVTSPDGSESGVEKSSPAKSQPSTPPKKTTEVLHSGIGGQFMARNLPTEVPDSLDMEVFVTKVDNPALLWVQLVQDRSMKGFREVSLSLGTVYPGTANEGELSLTPKVGGVCAVRYSEDGNWYRGEVVSVDESNRCKVRLIDFGRVDVVPMEDLRKLQDEMLKLPQQALKCYLSGIKQPQAGWSSEATKMLEAYFQDYGSCCRAKFKGQGAEGREIELYSAVDHGETLSSVLISTGLAAATISSVPIQPSGSPGSLTPATPSILGSVLDGLSVGMQVDIQVSLVDSPSCFYANLTDSGEALVELDRSLNECYAEKPPQAGYRPRPGELCAARFSEDNRWYRAVSNEQVPLAQEQSLPVTFIDYGNSDTISIDECRPLEVRFTMLPRQAVPCCLAGVRPTTEKWPEDMMGAFKLWLKDGRASIMIKAKTGNQLKVEIFSLQSEEQKCSFNTLLQNYGFGMNKEDSVPNQVVAKSADSVLANQVASTPTTAPKTEIAPRCLPVAEPPDREFQGFVTVVNNPSDFYLQVFSEENMKVFQELSEELNTRYALQDLEPYKPSVGETCAAVYSDDAWYRALVMDHVSSGPGLQVLFVDYGNIEVLPLDRIRQLEDRFYKVPVMALRCGLTCVAAPSSDKKGSWNEAATKHFADKVQEKLCQVSIAKRGDGKCDVELLYPGDGSNVNQLTSVKRDLIQHGWALPKDASSSNHIPALGSGDHAVANQGAAVEASPDMSKSCGTSLANHVPPQSTSANQDIATLPLAELPTEDFLGLVTAVGDHGDVYLQVATHENAEAMQLFTEDLNQYYMQAPQRPHKVRVGEICAAKYSLDDSWYRAQVVSGVTKDSTSTVLFVDFGNTDTVSLENIRKLDERFITIPVFALQCHLSGLSAPSGVQVWNNEATKYITEKFLGKSCKVHVTKFDGKVCEAVIHYSNDDINWLSINEELMKEGLAKPITMKNPSPGPSGDHQPTNQEQPKRISHVASPSTENKQHIQPLSSGLPGDQSTANQRSPGSGAERDSANGKADVRSGDRGMVELAKLPEYEAPLEKFTGVLTCVNHPCDFYLQVKNDDYIQLSLLLREELNQSYEGSHQPPHVPRVGELCAAIYSADNAWYRALALEHLAPESAVKVMFLDYGNCEVVPVERIQKLEGVFLEVPRLSRRCSLSGVRAPSGDARGPWSAEAASYISRELIEKDKECQIKVVKHDGKVCEVELHYSSDDGDQCFNLKEELLRKGLVRPVAVGAPWNKEPRLLARSLQKASLPSDTPIKVVVNKVEGPQEFYCQMVIEQEIEKLQLLMEDINSTASNRPLTAPPVVGDLCLARFTDDDIWYRAEILKIKQSDKRALVYYIDFGNKEPLSWSRLGAADASHAVLPMQAIRCGLQGVSPNPTTCDEKTKAFVCDLLMGDVNSPKCLEARLTGMSSDGVSLVELVDLNTDTNINQIVRNHYAMRQPAISPTPSKSPQPTLGVSPGISGTSPRVMSPRVASPGVPSPRVASPGVTSPDQAKLEALKQEMELKKKKLEAQIEAQQRELAEVEQLRASLEHGLTGN